MTINLSNAKMLIMNVLLRKQNILLSTKEIAEETNLPYSTVNVNLRALLKDNLILKRSIKNNISKGRPIIKYKLI